jgi:hypothetical protein
MQSLFLVLRGAWGSSNMREEEHCQNDTVQFSLFLFFLILTLFLFYLWGTQKWVTTTVII